MTSETDFCFPGLLGVWLTRLPLPNINGFLSAFCCSAMYIIFGTSHHISIGEVYFVLWNFSTGPRDYVQCCFKKLVRCPNLFHLICRCYLGENPDPQILSSLLFHFCSWPVVRISPSQSCFSCWALCTPEDMSYHRHQCEGGSWGVMEAYPA